MILNYGNNVISSSGRTIDFDNKLFLDLFPDAAVAYSVRKLRNNYNGNCLRVRRSSDNTELDIGFIGNNLDVASLVSFVGIGNNGFVKTFYDQSGNNKDSTQTDLTRQPQIVSGGTILTTNGLPTLRLDGVNDFLLTPNVTLPTYFSLFSVGVFTTTSPYLSINHGTFNPSPSDGFFVNYDIFNTLAVYRSGLSQTVSNPATIRGLFSLFYGSSVPSNIQIYSNLTSRSLTISGTLRPNSNTTQPLYIGCRDGTTNFSNGTLQEVIIFPSEKNTDFTNIATNINSYFKTYSSNFIWNGNQLRILDLNPNSKNAYSVRALSSTYKGPILRINRSSDSTETDIYALQNGELDKTFMSNFVGNGNGLVATWYDQSGNGRHLATNSTAFQPIMVSGGTILTLNNKPTMRFDGVNDGLYIMFQPIFKNVTAGTAFVAARWVTLPAATRSLYHATTSVSPGNAPRFSIHGNSINRTNMAARRLDADSTSNNNSVTPISTASMYLITGVVDWGNADSYVYLNNILDSTNLTYGTSGATSNTDVVSFSLGNLSNGFGRGQNSNSEISEAIGYESIPNISNINIAINSYFNIYP